MGGKCPRKAISEIQRWLHHQNRILEELVSVGGIAELGRNTPSHETLAGEISNTQAVVKTPSIAFGLV
jgi:hypothetical protein